MWERKSTVDFRQLSLVEASYVFYIEIIMTKEGAIYEGILQKTHSNFNIIPAKIIDQETGA